MISVVIEILHHSAAIECLANEIAGLIVAVGPSAIVEQITRLINGFPAAAAPLRPDPSVGVKSIACVRRIADARFPVMPRAKPSAGHHSGPVLGRHAAADRKSSPPPAGRRPRPGGFGLGACGPFPAGI